MKDILVVFVAVLVVLLFVRITFRRKKLPPKAQFIRDIWKWAESPQTPMRPPSS